MRTASKNIIFSLLIILLSFVLQPTPLNAQSEEQDTNYNDRLDAYMQTQMATYNIPGAAIAIVHNGEIEYIKGFGTANSEGEPVTPDTPFLIASLSKSITAFAIMQLVEAGKISLDDPVQQHLPYFEVQGEDSAKITIAHLTYQTSGLSTLDGQYAHLIPDSPDALETSVRSLQTRRLKFVPGEGWEYSNYNYVVLGLLIEAVSGQPYERYIEDHIFTPLGMSHSFTSMSQARAGGAASGYYPFFGFPLEYDAFMPYTQAALPSGGLWSTASDMSHYLLAHLNDGVIGESSIISAAGIMSLHEPGYKFTEQYGYAMGWNYFEGFLTPALLEPLDTTLKEYDQLTVLFHDGDWAGYKSVALLIPEANYGVVILLNTNDPAVTSAFRFFAWDILLIATGADAMYAAPAEGFIVRYARWIFSLVVLILAGEMLVGARMLRGLRRGSMSPLQQKHILIYGAVALLVDMLLLAYVFLKILPDNATSLPIMLRFSPDLGLIGIALLLLAGGWGLVRTMWMAARLSPI